MNHRLQHKTNEHTIDTHTRNHSYFKLTSW